MSEILKNGQKVKYQDSNGSVKTGIVHGVRTKEIANGDGTTTIIDRTYLIDTGEKVVIFADDIDKKTGEVIGTIPYETDQPVQLEVRLK